MAKPSLPQGTRDFGPDTVKKRNHIFSTIREVFELYGFQPLETPAMENLETLMGKYGEEGDKLIFKILNNGLDNPAKQTQVREDWEKVLMGKNVKGITERALKYDLTIPFARYVAMNHAHLHFPFKRYQVQPVWRADRPQRGRYREFYQCDADVVGSTSLLNETELAIIYATVFEKLGIPVVIKLNNRKVLAALAELTTGIDNITNITVAIDKLDKIGLEKVKEELVTKSLSPQHISLIEKYLAINGDNAEKIRQATALLGKNSHAIKGLKELEEVHASVMRHFPRANIEFDFTLARGLNYYTGIIFEVKAMDVQMGSIGGGGRYDDLTGLFGLPNIPGVGISFGVDRIFDVMDELKLFPADVFSGTQALVFNTGEETSGLTFDLCQQLREKGIRAELYHENSKFDKQFKYAEKKNIPYVIIVGPEEINESTCKVKDIRSGVQQVITIKELLETFLFK